MKNLIKLDFYAMKPLAKTMMLFLIIPIIIGLVSDVSISIMITLTFVVFMLNMIFAITEKSNFHKLYGILPIKKNTTIYSRYLFSLIIIGFAAIIAFLIFIILSILLYKHVNWINGFAMLMISIVISLFFISIQYPFYFKFDYSKATLMSILPYILCFAIGSPLLQYLMKNIQFYTIVMETIQYFLSNIVVLMALGISLCVFMLGISCLSSIKLQKKEF